MRNKCKFHSIHDAYRILLKISLVNVANQITTALSGGDVKYIYLYIMRTKYGDYLKSIRR